MVAGNESGVATEKEPGAEQGDYGLHIRLDRKMQPVLTYNLVALPDITLLWLVPDCNILRLL